MVTVFSDSYAALVHTLIHMKKELELFPSENVTNCCISIFSNAKRLDSSGALESESLADNSMIL